jgi:Asp-tRNA(Asn)/Glu-tRNA(Gln) amidotransferase A subunit family amidase
VVVSLVGHSAIETAEMVAAGAVSATEVIAAHLEAIGATEHLNAFNLVEADVAMERAEHLDRRREDGETLGPLAGVPIALKDLIDHAGRVTTCGSSFYRHTAEQSAPVVERLEAADAIVIGRTGLHEFAFGFSSENEWWGPVRNPWNTDTSPGGSSGGSAAAVAARLTPIGIGTDTGGSVRVPAALCGIIGLKVTHGRIPIRGVFPLAASLDTVGPLATTTSDISVAYQVLAGHDPGDPWSAPVAVAPPHGLDGLAGLRIALPLEWLDAPLDRAARIGFAAAIERMSALGVEFEEVSEPQLRPPGMINEAAYGEVVVVHGDWFTDDPERYGPEVRERMEIAMASDLTTYTRALEWRSSLRHAVGRLLNTYDLIATPAVAAGPKQIGEDLVPIEDGEAGYREVFSWFTALVNHAGNPAIVLPLDAEGRPPPSLQLVAPRWRESTLIAVADLLEKAGVVARRSPQGAAA